MEPIKNESGLYQQLSKLVQRFLNMERVEPANESGFPDIHFNWRKGIDLPEGTIELKFFKAKEKVNLKTTKMRGNQKAAHLEYYYANGKRRFIMAYHNGDLYVWNTEQGYNAILGRPHDVRMFPLGTSCKEDFMLQTKLISWLKEVLA